MRRGLGHFDFDWFLLFVAVAIAAVGVVEIYSTTALTPLAGQYKKQIYAILLGCVLAAIVRKLDYRVVVEQVPWLFAGGVILLGALLLKGHSTAGVRRWIPLGIATFQVSEFVKLVIILGVAAILAESGGKSAGWKDLGRLSLLVGIPAVLVAVEPDLGTALTYLPIAAVGVFMAGMRPSQIFILVLAGALLVPVGWHFARPYQKERLKSFVHPTEDVRGSHYQATQSRIAIGSGGFWGKGIGNGTQSKLGFVPVSHADFIFAAFAEEQGFIGTLFVMMLYFALLLRLLDIAANAGDRAGTLIVVGLVALLFFQVAVNIGMMIGFLPITGIPLPLMSQGGSSVLATFIGLGLAMSVQARRLVNN